MLFIIIVVIVKNHSDRWMVVGFEPKKNSFIAFGVCPERKLATIEY
jgi:hypothetical protein